MRPVAICIIPFLVSGYFCALTVASMVDNIDGKQVYGRIHSMNYSVQLSSVPLPFFKMSLITVDIFVLMIVILT